MFKGRKFIVLMCKLFHVLLKAAILFRLLPVLLLRTTVVNSKYCGMALQLNFRKRPFNVNVFYYVLVFLCKVSMGYRYYKV